MNLVEIWEERLFPRPKKKSPLVYEKEDGENKESTLETLRADGIMNPGG